MIRSFLSATRLRDLGNWIKQRLWIKPLALSILSIGGIFIASFADDRGLSSILPEISMDSVESLLSIMAASMLVIATFAVGSMVAAYASASTSATPRSFSLVISDDVTQNALSAYIGAFIFSLVSLVAVKNAMFGSAGLFAMFTLTALVFAVVIGTFVRWVDRIARLGRVSNTIEKLEKATADALDRRRHSPILGASPATRSLTGVTEIVVYSPKVGYVQSIDMKALQSLAENSECYMRVAVLPGAFVSQRQALLRVAGSDLINQKDCASAFKIGRTRAFDDDPRFGILALAEIGGKSLSPGINDPGTAIEIIGTMVRLFALWQSPFAGKAQLKIEYDRISVQPLDIEDLFDDAFTAIARDGAAIVEVAVRLQKAFAALADTDDTAMAASARQFSRMALARSEQAMSHPNDIARVRASAGFSSAA